MRATHKDDQNFSPIFMFGFERSGTTLLSMMVGAHPEMAVPLSTAGMWYDFHKQRQEKDGKRPEHLVDLLLNHERIQLWDTTFDRSQIISSLNTGTVGDCLSTFHKFYAKQKGKHYWASMDISHMENLALLNSWFPKARFVHIIRDPRDVALSFKGYRYGTSNILETAQRWAQSVGCSLREGAILGQERYYRLRYEDLILKPEESLTQLCGFLGISYAPQMLDYGKMVGEKVPENKRSLWPALHQKPQTGKVERWRRALSKAESAIIEDYTRPLLDRLDYPVRLTGQRPLRSFILELWHFTNRGRRIERALKKVLPK